MQDVGLLWTPARDLRPEVEGFPTGPVEAPCATRRHSSLRGKAQARPLSLLALLAGPRDAARKSLG